MGDVRHIEMDHPDNMVTAKVVTMRAGQRPDGKIKFVAELPTWLSIQDPAYVADILRSAVTGLTEVADDLAAEASRDEPAAARDEPAAARDEPAA